MKTTIFGGMVFLIPITIIVVIFGKALVFTRKLSEPFAEILPFSPLGDAIVVDLLGLLLIILICFLAGLATRLEILNRLTGMLETKFLAQIPIYSLFKATVSNSSQSKNTKGMKTVIVQFDDCWQIAFEVERIAGGNVAVFLPGSPNPWSGSICYVSEDRIKHLDTNLRTVTGILIGFGKGSNKHIAAKLVR